MMCVVVVDPRVLGPAYHNHQSNTNKLNSTRLAVSTVSGLFGKKEM